jgi:hypothetical protein
MKSELVDKYIIIDPEEGIFLGTAKNEDMMFVDRHPKDNRLVALFSCNNVMDITKAVGFLDKDDAHEYLRVYLKRRCPKAFVAAIKDDTIGPYADVVSIVKSGYGSYAWDMIDAMPMQSEIEH